MLDRDGWRCLKCGKGGALEVDHIIPLHKGGAMFDPANCQTLCKAHHRAKTQIDLNRVNPERDKWRDYLLKMSS